MELATGTRVRRSWEIAAAKRRCTSLPILGLVFFLACSCALQPAGINNQTSTNVVTTSLTRCLGKVWRRIAIFL